MQRRSVGRGATPTPVVVAPFTPCIMQRPRETPMSMSGVTNGCHCRTSSRYQFRAASHLCITDGVAATQLFIEETSGQVGPSTVLEEAHRLSGLINQQQVLSRTARGTNPPGPLGLIGGEESRNMLRTLLLWLRHPLSGKYKSPVIYLDCIGPNYHSSRE